MTRFFWTCYVPVVLVLLLLSGIWAPSVDVARWIRRWLVRRELRRMDRISAKRVAELNAVSFEERMREGDFDAVRRHPWRPEKGKR